MAGPIKILRGHPRPSEAELVASPTALPTPISPPRDLRYHDAMEDFPIVPPLVIKDTPKPQRLTKLSQARTYVDEAMRIGRPEPWREVWHRLKSVSDEEDAIEAIGDLRELLIEEDLLLPSA